MNNDALEFNVILNRLADFALSKRVKDKLLGLTPYLSEKECRLNMQQTTEAVQILEAQGTPPIATMTELDKILDLTEKGAMLTVEELVVVSTFIASCNRVVSYLKKSQSQQLNLSLYSDAFGELNELYEEINVCIRNNQVDSNASPKLRDVRRKIENCKEMIKNKLESILKSKKGIFAESYVVMRNGVQVLPVKQQYKNQIKGTVVETSNTGGTCFIEPDSVKKLQQQLYLLEIDEDNEVRTVLYTLTALVETYIGVLRSNMEYMETLDYVFAKAKLSVSMNGIEVPVVADRHIVIKQGRHPLIDSSKCVPLDFEIGEDVNGIIITGPNTGGKTVAIKTVGLLSLMAQSGLHIPVSYGTKMCMNVNVLCDIGDGQSISQSLSTFSSHIANVIEIIKNVTSESLVLLDELGSGTDPKEGMGIAVCILEELRMSKCLFVATTHYPEVKDYARDTDNVVNARMEFDKDSLKPMYKMVIGEAGESCAFYIAERLGLPVRMLDRAKRAVYGEVVGVGNLEIDKEFKNNVGKIQKDVPIVVKDEKTHDYRVGDSVKVLTTNDMGIVYNVDDKRGNVIVQVKGERISVNHKRLELVVSRDELYPPDYDFSIIFDTVENRKARVKIGKGYTDVIIEEK